MNPFFQAMGGSPMGGMMQMMKQFQQFRQTFTGDPKAEVERLVREGRISQAQVDQAKEMAKQFAFLAQNP